MDGGLAYGWRLSENEKELYYESSEDEVEELTPDERLEITQELLNQNETVKWLLQYASKERTKRGTRRGRRRLGGEGILDDDDDEELEEKLLSLRTGANKTPQKKAKMSALWDKVLMFLRLKKKNQNDDDDRKRSKGKEISRTLDEGERIILFEFALPSLF